MKQLAALAYTNGDEVELHAAEHPIDVLEFLAAAVLMHVLDRGADFARVVELAKRSQLGEARPTAKPFAVAGSLAP